MQYTLHDTDRKNFCLENIKNRAISKYFHLLALSFYISDKTVGFLKRKHHLNQGCGYYAQRIVKFYRNNTRTGTMSMIHLTCIAPVNIAVVKYCKFPSHNVSQINTKLAH